MSAPTDFARDGAPISRRPVGERTHRPARPGRRGRGRPSRGARCGRGLLDRILAATGPVGALAARLTSPSARPVRAVMFDKTPEANWAVAWHQDRTLPVAERVEVEGFGPWSTKDGLLHVAPPFEILARMITLRVHLDPVDAANAPLRAALGSHRLGRVAAGDAAARAAEHPVIDCLAEPATSGPTPPRSCTPPTAPSRRAGGGCCRWTTPTSTCRAAWPGPAILRRPDLSATARAC
jgi:hypothetical protein